MGDSWEEQALAYGLAGDIGTPKNLGEEYRRNTPILNYAFDANFLNYFGSNGVLEVEKAIAVFNNLAKTNLSDYPANLSNFPLNTLRENYKAQALSLMDLKSRTMNVLIEELGLAEPERWVWCLHDRYQIPGTTCPDGMEYLVIKRNFDPLVTPLNQSQVSSFVNGTLYSYYIVEYCTPTPPVLADAVEFRVDPLATGFTSVAGGADYYGVDLVDGISVGRFYTGLTRDDVGGLRYLMRASNMNVEFAGASTVTIVTNKAPQLQQPLFTGDFHLFSLRALTNDPGTLAALYPGLIITGSTPIFTNIVSTNTTAFFTNSPYDSAGTPARLVFATNYVTNVVTYFHHTFANVLTGPYYTNSLPYYTNGLVSLLTTNISPGACHPWSIPTDGICTNVSQSTPFLTNDTFGDFFIIPTNSCGVSIVATQLVTTVYVTNSLVDVTNIITGTSNVFNEEFSQNLIYSYQQHAFIINPVECPTNTVALRQGIESIRFVRQNFDSLIGDFQSYEPVTNDYVLTAVTNSTAFPQHIRRVSYLPDVVFTAGDLATPSGVPPGGGGDLARSVPQYIAATNAAVSGLVDGPGILSADVTPGDGATGGGGTNIVITYDKVGPSFFNASPYAYFFNAEYYQSTEPVWGSFDGSTNDPVVYPNGASVANLESQILIPITPAGGTLPDGQLGVNYATVFSGFTAAVPSSYGWTLPTTWSLSPDSSALPLGLTLNANGTITGTPVGDLNGTYDIIVRLSDSAVTPHHVDWQYSIRINP